MDDNPIGFGGGGEEPPSPNLLDVIKSKASYLIGAGLFVVGNATGYMAGRSSAPQVMAPVAAPAVVPTAPAKPAPVEAKPAPASPKKAKKTKASPKKAKKSTASTNKKKAKKSKPTTDE